MQVTLEGTCKQWVKIKIKRKTDIIKRCKPFYASSKILRIKKEQVINFEEIWVSQGSSRISSFENVIGIKKGPRNEHSTSVERHVAKKYRACSRSTSSANEPAVLWGIKIFWWISEANYWIASSSRFSWEGVTYLEKW